MRYKVFGISSKVAERVRATGRSPGYGHPAHTELAAGYGPCRHCLQFFREGEEQRTLFTFDPFYGIADPLPGPVFIHTAGCERYSAEAFPGHLSEHRLTLVAYGDEGATVQVSRLPAREGAEAEIAALLSRPEVRYIHVRDTEAGCYDCTIERA